MVSSSRRTVDKNVETCRNGGQGRLTVKRRVEQDSCNRDVRLQEVALVGHDGPGELVLAYGDALSCQDTVEGGK